jgi:hypothetical protein
MTVLLIDNDGPFQRVSKQMAERVSLRIPEVERRRAARAAADSTVFANCTGSTWDECPEGDLTVTCENQW